MSNQKEQIFVVKMVAFIRVPIYLFGTGGQTNAHNSTWNGVSNGGRFLYCVVQRAGFSTAAVSLLKGREVKKGKARRMEEEGGRRKRPPPRRRHRRWRRREGFPFPIPGGGHRSGAEGCSSMAAWWNWMEFYTFPVTMPCISPDSKGRPKEASRSFIDLVFAITRERQSRFLEADDARR